MQQPRHNMGTVKRLAAEALGEPGQRAFRIVVEAELGTASIWMEKEQLSALALSISSYVKEIEAQPQRTMSLPAETASAEPAFDFKVTSLGLTYDEATGRFGILAYDARDAEREVPTLIFWSPKAQAEAMAEEALKVVSQGRPVCPLCHRPMDKEGHMCPRYNGHGPVQDHLGEP